MNSSAKLAVVSLALLLAACGSGTSNTTTNTTNAANSGTTSNSTSNASNSSNTANSSNTSGTASGESGGSHPIDQVDTAAKIENGKTLTIKSDITLTMPADWKKDSRSNDNADWYTGKTKDGKELTLVVLWMPAESEYEGLSTPEAAIKYLKESREYAEKNPDRYSLPRILKLADRAGVAEDSKSATPDGLDEWSWTTFDSADFKKSITFKYPAGSFDQHKSIRDGIINSLKFNRGPRTP